MKNQKPYGPNLLYKEFVFPNLQAGFDVDEEDTLLCPMRPMKR